MTTTPSYHDRLDELKVQDRNISVNKGYTRFVKFMRYGLPILAVALVAVVVTWPEMDDKIVVVDKVDILPESQNDIGQNELLNPKFETTDAQQQPVNVTANRALQNSDNPNLVKLEKPVANLKMKDGAQVNIEALDGTYEQESEKLFLQNEVKIKHESGYELNAEELRVDMKTREAFSDKNVSIDGPDAMIEATGLEGNVDDGVLIFKGPAKLTIKNKPESEDVP
jgi:lipopolysaccharide export system protein LptC